MVTSNQASENQIWLEVRPALGDVELNELFNASWPDHRPASFSGMLARSLCWVAAYREGALVGFVNVATDGGIHAFILDTTVHPPSSSTGGGCAIGAACCSGSTFTWCQVVARRL
ncbi:hypothetical protein LDL08_28860 [Nonomuraea glycinis]|uniref:Uncharacterized protein n=1 Tax=Nonomuraea glycinis TaxID=2047744 RepID=A0A918AAK6_9ACTN|nr:hypothetical protein [Nonomuraea glycinis]MCA2180198.1 hypothetical protein [Nonomuraea glycinis]GGP11064.1 hypothetical protein GCM10012278_53320 [Nonomuraea glycinis]